MITAARSLGVLALAASAAALAEPPPAAAFFKNIEFDDVRLSPDGMFLAAIARIEAAPDARNLVVLNIDSGKSEVLTGYDDEDVRWFAWAGAERLIFTLSRDEDARDKANIYFGAYSLSRDGSNGIVLDSGNDGRGLDIIDLLQDDVHALVAVPSHRRVFPDVYRLNVKTGGRKKIASNKASIRQWFTDNTGTVRAAIDAASESEDNLRFKLIHRESASSEWQSVLDFNLGEVHVYGFDADNEHIWLAARIGRDKFALYKFDPDGRSLEKPALADAEYDVYSRYSRASGLMQDEDGTPIYFQYMAEKPKTLFFDQRWAARQATLDGALPDTVNMIVGWDRDEQRFLIQSTSDRVSGVYYLYDEGDAKIRYLLSGASWLDSGQMADMRPISFETRDGLTLRGYLTLPRDVARGPVPLIVHPHGGPYGIRDEWGFNAEVQFLASRGYGVLQVNYRGSGGYGLRFETIGYRRWGLEMQDDITDGVQWAIDEGYADPDRICIYGASYGGYATMAGLTKTPELYKCGINYVGVIDLAMLHRQITSAGFTTAGVRGPRREWAEMTLGNPRTEHDRFHATSPINFVRNIRAPLFVIHGRLDYNVEIEQYQALVRQLKKHDKTFETMTERYQGHGFFAESASIELHERIEKFLSEHL